MAILAAYLLRSDRDETLPTYLDRLLAGRVGEAVRPDPKDVAGFDIYLKRYIDGLSVEGAAVDSLA